MMNTWWFKLHTKKSIMWAGLTFFLVVILDIIDSFLPVTDDGFEMLVFVAILLWTIKKMKIGCRQATINYSFYLNTFSINEVIRINLLNLLVSCSAFFLSLIMASFVTQYTGGGVGKFFNETIAEFSWPMLLMGMLLVLVFLSMVSLASIPLFRAEHEKSKDLKIFSQTMGFSIVGSSLTIIYLVLLYFGFHSLTVAGSFLGIIFLSSLFNSIGFLRRKTKTLNSFKGILKGFSAGLVTIFPLFIFATYLSSLDFDNKKFSPEIKASRYKIGSPFTKLDRETLIEMAPHMYAIRYESLAFDLNQEGPAFFTGPALQRLLIDHLRKKRANEEFLVSLYDDFSLNKEEWEKSKRFKGIKYLAFHSWPQDRELPERFIALKQTAREIASQKD